jgi:hypothetical protein
LRRRRIYSKQGSEETEHEEDWSMEGAGAVEVDAFSKGEEGLSTADAVDEATLDYRSGNKENITTNVRTPGVASTKHALLDGPRPPWMS